MSKYLDSVIKEMNDYGNMGMPDGEGSMGMGSQAPTGKLKDAYKMQQLKTNQMLRRRSQAEEEEGSMGGADDMSAMGAMDSMGDMEGGMGDEEGMGADMDSMGDMEGGMGDEEGMDDGMGTEDDVASLQQFFTDNPEPSDQEISQYADENGMDLMGMRRGVYALIQSLLPAGGEEGMDDGGFDWMGSGSSGDEAGMDDMDDMGDEEGMDDGSMDGMDDSGETSELDFSVPGDTGERPAKKEFEEQRFGRRRSDRR